MSEEEMQYSEEDLKRLDRTVNLKFAYLTQDLGADVSFDGLRTMMLVQYLVDVGVITEEQMRQFQGRFLSTQVLELDRLIGQAKQFREAEEARARSQALASRIILPNGHRPRGRG